MSPRRSVQAERVHQVLDGACRAIVEHGFDRVRFADIAAAAGTSIGTVQYYFGSLDRVLSAALCHANEQAVRSWRERGLQMSPTERLALLLALCIPDEELGSDRGTFVLSWRLWLEFWAKAARDKRFLPDNEALYKTWSSLYRDVIERGVRQCDFRLSQPVDDIADELVALVDGLSIRVLIGHESMPPERMRRLVLAFVESHLGVGTEEFAAVMSATRGAVDAARAQ